jgi:hypothetical protein
MRTVKLETFVISHSTWHMATFSFRDSVRGLFWPTEHVCMNVCVCVCVCVCKVIYPLYKADFFSPTVHASPPIQNISAHIYTRKQFPRMQYFDCLTKCSLSVSKLPLAEIMNEEGGGWSSGVGCRSAACIGQTEWQLRLSISFEFSSVDLFLFQCLILVSVSLLLYFILSFPLTNISISPTYVRGVLIST